MSAPPKFPGTGLEEVNVPGQAYLREALSCCDDPLKAIENFQLENGILLPSLRPMLPLLDLHGVRRLDFHTSVLEELRDKLIAHINEVGAKEGRERDRKLKELLVKSFPVVRVKALRPVVMCILRNTSHIDDKYLRILVRDRELYQDTDTEVKRQIWRDNQSLFGDEVSPLLSQYIREKEHILFDHLNLNNLFFTPTPKVRRQGEVVQKLAHMIGNSVKLYDMVLQFLRTLFLRTRNVHYCTLRAELLMALHDLEVQDIISVDPCHKFTWCLDACIREKNVDIKRSRELQGFLDNIKRGQEQVLGDLSMTLCDPYAINFLATSAIKILQHLINNEGLPRDNTILILLLRMLALGLSAWIMIDSQDFKEPKLDSQVVTKFLPALMSLMVDDQVRNLHSKLPPDERESAITTIEHSGPAPDAVEAYIQESSVASILAMYYTLHTARQKDRVGILRVMAILASCKDDRAYEDPFLHSLIALMIPMSEEFANEDFCTGLFDEFLFAGLTRDNVTRHMLKLLWYIHAKLPQARLQTLLKALQPNAQHHENVHKLYENLQKRVMAAHHHHHPHHETMPEPMETDFDSPLKSVPTPGPHYV
nr:negative elongation factor B-like [Aedes albopictus]